MWKANLKKKHISKFYNKVICSFENLHVFTARANLTHQKLLQTTRRLVFKSSWSFHFCNKCIVERGDKVVVLHHRHESIVLGCNLAVIHVFVLEKISEALMKGLIDWLFCVLRETTDEQSLENQTVYLFLWN